MNHPPSQLLSTFVNLMAAIKALKRHLSFLRYAFLWNRYACKMN